jgi:hypothetical protein
MCPHPSTHALLAVQEQEFPGSVVIPDQVMASYLMQLPLDNAESRNAQRAFIRCIANRLVSKNAFFYKTKGGFLGFRINIEPAGYISPFIFNYHELITLGENNAKRTV